jgi:PfaB family protein
LGDRPEALFAVEADRVEDLRDALSKLRELAVRSPTLPIEKLAGRWWREHAKKPHAKRAVALVASDADELARLADFAAGWLRDQPDRPLPAPSPLAERIFYAPAPLESGSELAFVFPGSGNHFPGMGRDLSALWPELLRKQDSENALLRSQFVPELFWNRETIPEQVSHRDLIFGQVTVGILVSDVVRRFGVHPQAVIGYSLGESAGLFALGAWTSRDDMYRRMTASSLFTSDLAGICTGARKTWRLPDAETVDWLAGVVGAPAPAVRVALAGRDRVYLLIVNTPQQCVIGGQRRAVEQLVRDLGCPFVPLSGVSTVHCPIARQV